MWPPGWLAIRKEISPTFSTAYSRQTIPFVGRRDPSCCVKAGLENHPGARRQDADGNSARDAIRAQPGPTSVCTLPFP